MFKNYVKIAFRNLFRNKVYTTINISCLAFGMACTILLLLWVQDECNYDGFHKNANTIFLIHKSVFTPKREFWTRTTPAPLAYDLHQKYPEIINTARVARAGELVVKYQDKMFVEKQVAGVDPGYFEMFTVPFLKGDSLTALSQPYSIIITEALALKYFGETNPMGQILRINNQFDCLVRGIIQNSPTNTNNRFDAFVPFTFLKALGFDPENYHADNCLTYVQIQPNLNYQSLSQKIFNQFSTPVPAKEAVEKFYLIPLTEVRFYRNVHKIVVYVFSILAGVILLIACINYINLSTAQAMNRTREVGIRKVVGATQSQLGWQFLGESLWITLLALILALVLVEIFLPLFNYHSGKQLAIDYANYRMLLSFPGIGLLTGIVAGSYPAFFLAAFKPTSVLKKNLFQGLKGSLSRKILVVTQFSFAIILIIATIYLYRQIDFLQHSDFGFEDEQIIFTNLKGEIPSRFNSVRQELLQHPYIESVTAAYHLPFANGYYTTVREAANPENSSHAVWDVVDDDYLHTLKMKLTQGRFFSREYPTDPDQAMVINESMVKALRFTDPIGQSVILQGKPYTIIGVIRDFHNRPLVYPIEPMVLTLGKTDYAILFARIDAPNANAESGTMNDIKAICQKFSPHYPLEFRYLAGFALEGTDDMQAAGRVLLIFTILGIGISCLGLYGLSLFLTEQRKKEVGIRKALGSSVLGIIRLFSKEYVLLLMLANAIAWPIAYFFVNLAIQSAYRVEFSFWIFIVTGVSVLLLALLTVGYRAFRTALANPVEALQYE